MRAQPVNFERGQDPKKALKIGAITYNTMGVGTILKCKNTTEFSSGGRIKPINHRGKQPYIAEDQYMIITGSWKYEDFPKGRYSDMYSSATAYTMGNLRRDLKDPNNNRRLFSWRKASSILGAELEYNKIKDPENGRDSLFGAQLLFISPGEFKSRFEIIEGVRESVNFERGLDPKDALEIGNKEVREFRKALKSDKTYNIPVISNMIDGLINGSVTIAEAERFVRKSIGDYDKRQKLLWYDWMYDDGEIFWDKYGEQLVIKFPMPNMESMDIEREIEIRATIAKSMSEKYGEMFKTRVLAKVRGLDIEYTEEHFDQDNWFEPDDLHFGMGFVINIIRSVVNTTIKNLG